MPDILNWTVSQVESSPGEWFTGLFVLLSFLFTVYLNWTARKKVKLEIDNSVRYSDEFYLVVANASDTKSIKLKKYGYKIYWGETWEDKASVEIEPGDVTDLLLLRKRAGKSDYYSISENYLKLIYYTYVIDTTGKKYKKYTTWIGFAILKRMTYVVEKKLQQYWGRGRGKFDVAKKT